MKSKTDINQIPKTGRIGRFAKIVEKMTDKDPFVRIMQDSPEYENLQPDETAEWWKKAVERLENEVGSDKSVTIMRTCGSKCCGNGQRESAKKLMTESSSLIDFLDKLSKYKVKDGVLEYKLVDNNTIIAKHNKCFCGQVRESKEKFKNRTYCQCSVEFNKQFFEAALGKNVDVVLKQSIINGGDCCEFEVKMR
ncbi:MAG: DUF6144 family protein [Candidatus Paceibacterota bacterium]|jgi:predicted ArsR family transcriptional regulator|nr:DUF6144 family protein [Clostridia bacterium]